MLCGDAGRRQLTGPDRMKRRSSARLLGQCCQGNGDFVDLW
jgi:hypothetical protein